MVSIGLKALPYRTHHRSFSSVEQSVMGETENLHKHGRRKKAMSRKAEKPNSSFDGYKSNKGAARAPKSSKRHNPPEPQELVVRKQVDPETAKYFTEIINLFESNGVDMEEKSVICGNALEEARGKELELATDYILSHNLQTLLEGCDVDHLCGFLRSSTKAFPYIAMDRSGSHVAETALKALARHAQDQDVYSLVEDTLNMICKVLIVNPVEVMCNCHGSHVLRRLLCVCKGVPLDSSEFHGIRTSTVLAERLNLKESRLDGFDTQNTQQGFPGLMNFLVSGLLNGTRQDIIILQVDQYGSLVLQTALKLLAGQDEDLLKIILKLLGCDKENAGENFIEMTAVRDIIEMMKETAYSHLMEVIIEVAPGSLYDELFTKVFRNSLFKISSHQCGNFVVQALISHARSQYQMELIWEELGQKFRALLEMGRSGVVASLIASSQRLHTHEHKCCQALASAVCSTNDSPSCIVPRLLFLESYFFCVDKSNWKWESGSKMHVVGSLILQAIFKYQSEYIQPYITSIAYMEADQALEAAKDPGGARVIEAFLCSNASAKLKRRLVIKLRGHFGELALHPPSSFTVEKCFTAGSLSLREAIVSELLPVQTDLAKTKQGPYLLRKLDVDGFAYHPDQWRSKQASKQSAYKEFYDMFGSSKTKSSENDTFLVSVSKQTAQPKDIKNMRKEIDDHLASAAPFLSMSGHKRRREKVEQRGENFAKKGKKGGKNKNHGGSESSAIVRRTVECIGNNQSASKSADKKGKKRQRNDIMEKASNKKLKA
ncbi:pumilio 23 [Tripterygium wilfordii]|uniref:Pumilio 23 n=1 Tax=Tripterygium wilfordii TaxID=458696 RepID=A0A7J7CD68_TRIWF|nr:pumilio homolog 23 [Tripterygium wilfordii]KAF5732078.1 pumilio 23 [Tripterygium wilfordii]